MRHAALRRVSVLLDEAPTPPVQAAADQLKGHIPGGTLDRGPVTEHLTLVGRDQIARKLFVDGQLAEQGRGDLVVQGGEA